MRNPFTALFREVEDTVGILQTSDEDFTLQPNPASGMVKVVAHCRMTYIELIDAQGRLALSYQADGDTALLDISRLTKGSYVVKVHSEQGTSTHRLVIE